MTGPSSAWWRQAACPHRSTTRADRYGDAICMDCGGVVCIAATKAMLDRALDDLRGKGRRLGP